MKEALTGTWFMLHGDERISVTRRQSHPGLSVDFNPVASPFHQFDAAVPTESFDCLGPIWAEGLCG